MVLYKKHFLMPKILIIGGSGYLGYNLFNYLIKQGYQVTIGDIKNDYNVNEYLYFDLLDESTFPAFDKFNIIINCAGQITNPIHLCYSLNTNGINTLTKQLENKEIHFIQISTAAIYGSVATANENTPVNPETPYAACKSFAEFLIINNLKNMSFAILRLCNLYGENQPKGFFAYLLKAASTDKMLEFNNDGSLSRYFIHVEDSCQAIMLALQYKLTGIYNITTEEQYSVSEIINYIEKRTNIVFTKKFNNAKPWENIGKLHGIKFNEKVGFKPNYTFLNYINSQFTSNS